MEGDSNGETAALFPAGDIGDAVPCISHPKPGKPVGLFPKTVQRRGYHNIGDCAPGIAVMLNDFAGAERVYIACGYTDLRLGIDGLATLVKRQFALDPFENCLFFL